MSAPIKCIRCGHEPDVADAAIKIQVVTSERRAAGRPVFVCSYLCGTALMLDAAQALPRKRGMRDVPDQSGGRRFERTPPRGVSS